MNIPPKMLATLAEARARHDLGLSPTCYERHRRGLIARGLVDRHGKITSAGLAALPIRTRRIYPWQAYPIGTVAGSTNGGAWTRINAGWKWGKPAGSGGVFPTPGGDASGNIEIPPKKVLHLVLTRHWFDEVMRGAKWTEYRSLTTVLATRLLVDADGDGYTHVRFARGYTQTITHDFLITHRDVGPCPYPGWPDQYLRIHYVTDLLP